MDGFFLTKKRAELGRDDLAALIRNQVREGREIEYKAVLHQDQTEERREFLADVCSFANSTGGHILYGVTEAEGLPTGIPGIEVSDADALILRLESSIRDGISPKIPLVRTLPLLLETGKYVVIIEIPKSWIGPHMVTFKNSSRFYSRNSAGKHQLDVQEIRNAFIASEDLSGAIRAFRADRLSRLISGEVPVPLIGNSLIVMQICPLISFRPGYRCDISAIERGDQLRLQLRPIQTQLTFAPRFTFDGYMNFENDYSSGKTIAYAEFLKNGCIESVNAQILTFNRDIPKFFFARRIEQETVQAMEAQLKLLVLMGVPAPAFLMFSLLNVKGYRNYLPPKYAGGTGGHQVERDNLIVPEILMDDYTEDAAKTLRPAFDSIWNACGFSHSWNYDRDGKWDPMC